MFIFDGHCVFLCCCFPLLYAFYLIGRVLSIIARTTLLSTTLLHYYIVIIDYRCPPKFSQKEFGPLDTIVFPLILDLLPDLHLAFLSIPSTRESLHNYVLSRKRKVFIVKEFFILEGIYCQKNSSFFIITNHTSYQQVHKR